MKPDKENTLSLLGDWAKHHAAIQKMMAGIKANIGLDLDGTMFVTVWAVFGAYTDTLACEIGDSEGWLDWYRFECEMGARSKTAFVGTKSIKVKTLAQLANVIIADRKHD